MFCCHNAQLIARGMIRKQKINSFFQKQLFLFSQQFYNQNHYETLGVTQNASTLEIKEAYLKLAKKFHPDVSEESMAQEKFKDISAAYDTLKDPNLKSLYDSQLNGQKEDYKYKREQEEHNRYGNNYANSENNNYYYNDYYSSKQNYQQYGFSQNQNFKREQYNYQQQYYNNNQNPIKNQTKYSLLKSLNVHWILLCGLGFILFDYIWSRYYDKEITLKAENTLKMRNALYDSNVRRQNMIMSSQSLDDTVQTQENRKKMLEQEMIQKQIRIEVVFPKNKKLSKREQKMLQQNQKQGVLSLDKQNISKSNFDEKDKTIIRQNLTIDQYQKLYVQ